MCMGISVCVYMFVYLLCVCVCVRAGECTDILCNLSLRSDSLTESISMAIRKIKHNYNRVRKGEIERNIDSV